ncbi:MAG TPA: hypothetical protein GX743_03485 [Actinomycetales bacterium]|nr:hypothetical protein [Actinomycetales bacterium]
MSGGTVGERAMGGRAVGRFGESSRAVGGRANVRHASLTARLRALRTDSERGSISSFIIVMTLALFLAVGLVVDGGRKIAAIEEATSIAQHSAVLAANQLDFTQHQLTGARPEIDVPRAVSEGNNAIAAAGAQAVPGIEVTGYTVCSRVQVTRDTAFLSLIGIGSVTGVGEVCGVEPRMNPETP